MSDYPFMSELTPEKIPPVECVRRPRHERLDVVPEVEPYLLDYTPGGRLLFRALSNGRYHLFVRRPGGSPWLVVDGMGRQPSFLLPGVAEPPQPGAHEAYLELL